MSTRSREKRQIEAQGAAMKAAWFSPFQSACMLLSTLLNSSPAFAVPMRRFFGSYCYDIFMNNTHHIWSTHLVDK